MPAVIVFRPVSQEEQARRILAAMAAIEECARYLREHSPSTSSGCSGDGTAPVKDEVVKEHLFTQDNT